MKKVIKEYYGMDVDKIIKTNSNYIFTYNKEKYLFYKCFNNFNMEEIIKITSYLYSKNIPMHIFIKNKNHDFITSKDNSTYILMKVICKEKVTYDDIINFNFIYSNGKCKWKELWSYKNDFYMKRLGFAQTKNDEKKLKILIHKWDNLLNKNTVTDDKDLIKLLNQGESTNDSKNE